MVVLLLGLVGTAAAAVAVHLAAVADAERLVDERADGVAESVRTHLHRYEDAVETIAGYLAVEDALDHARFVAFLDESRIIDQHDGMEGAGVIARVPGDEVASFEARRRAEGLEGFTVDTPGNADVVDVVAYNEPARRYAASWGADVRTLPGVSEALERAAVRGRATVTGSTTLPTDRRLPPDEQQRAFMLYAPVYADGVPTSTRGERQEAVVAWAHSPFRAQEVLDTLVAGLDPALAVELHDGAATGAGSRLAAAPAEGEVERRADRSLLFGGRRWTLRIGATGALTDPSPAVPLLVVVAGGLVSSALAAAAGRLLSARSRALARAEAATASLRASEARFEFVAEHASDLLSRHEPDGRFLYASPASRRILGYEPDELVGRSLDELLHPDDLAVVWAARRHGDADGHGIATFRARRHDGTWVWLESTGRVVVDDGRVELHASSRDVSVRRAAEAAVAASNAQLRAANAELARSNAELADFAYVVSHDLSEPLRVLAGYAELLALDKGDRLDDDGHEYVAAIRASADRLDQLIRDILHFSRAGSAPLALRPVEVERVAAEALEAISARVAERDAEVVVRPLPTVAADAAQLRQLLQNLLANAVKFVPPERRPRVELSATRDDGCWRFHVADNGIGIPVADRDRVFGMFSRLHSRDDYEGTGVGLAIARKVVERHGGEISVADSPLGGTAIAFTLPDAPATVPHPSPA